MSEKRFKSRYDDLFIDMDLELDEGFDGDVKKKEKKNWPWRKIIPVLALILLLCAFVFVLRFWKINDIYVEGLENVSQEYVLSLAGLSSGFVPYQYQPGKWKNSIETDPHLAVKSIKFEFPNRIVIQIQERNEYAVIQSSDQFIYIDENGYVLDISSILKDPDLLVIRGISLSGYAKNEMLGVRDEYQLYVLVQLLEALQTTGQRGWYALADIANPVEIAMRTTSNMTVRLGSIDEIEQKLTNVSAVLNKLSSDEKTSGILDAIQITTISYAPATASADDLAGSEENEPEEVEKQEIEMTADVENTPEVSMPSREETVPESDENAWFDAIPVE